MRERLGERLAGVLAPDIDEKAIGDRRTWRAEELVLAVSRAKCDALVSSMDEWLRCSGVSSGSSSCGGFAGDELLLCSDQVVRCEGQIREKPVDAAEAERFVRSYAGGAPAECVNGLVLHDLVSGRRVERVYISSVHIAPMTEAEIAAFVAEPLLLTCAGALRIEDPHMKVARLEGGEDGVMGLPIDAVLQLAAELERPAAAVGSVGAGGGNKRGLEETGLTTEAVEAQLASAAALTLCDEDLDLVLPSEGFEALPPPGR